jgi:hypothetical protein
VRLTHWFNFLFLTMLVRSGIEILAAHPKLYWSDHSLPTQAWLRFTRKQMPADRLWCSTDEEVDCPSWLGLPGGHNLGLGRYWHFATALGWLATGGLYVVLMFATPQWRRLVPTSWEVFPEAWRSFLMYATFHLPDPPGAYNYDPSLPFNALQQISYFGVIFLLTPLMIATGLALIVRRLYAGATLIATVLSAIFLCAVGSAWWRGLDITCGCFGKEENATNYPKHLTLNGALVLACLALVWLQRLPKEAPPAEPPPPEQ